MNTEDEQALQDTEKTSSIDLISTQLSEPVEDLAPLLADTGETDGFTDINTNNLANHSNFDSVSNADTSPDTNSPRQNKIAPGKKKCISDMQ